MTLPDLSLRARLVLGVIALVTVALVVAGAATYTALQGFLLGQIDSNLASGMRPALSYFGPGGGGDRPNFPPGSYLALYARDRQSVLFGGAFVSPFDSSLARARPNLPKVLPATATDSPSVPFTVEGTGGVSQYRVEVESFDELNNDYVVLALPMTEVNATLGHLLLLETIVGAGVLIATALVALVTVRLGLRPLGRMGDTAAAIAAGDLHRRVEPASEGTEIGRLGLALNAMLTQIEGAFAERTRSEQKLREFMAAASHELRTPLTSIRGYAEMLRRGAEASPADSRQARRRIEEESVRMTDLVDDMLLLARLDSGRPLELQQVDLARLAADAAADARAVAPEREVSLEVPEHVWLTGDEARLRQVVGNLVRNAVVHTPSRSPVEIAVRTGDGQAMLDVIDHGRGLDQAEAVRVFEPFYRADAGRSRDRGGSGLGLSIVAAVVAAHRGKVRVLATPGGGATFRVELPVDPAPAVPAGQEGIPARA